MKKKSSIRFKMILFSIAITFLLSFGIGYASYRNYDTNMKNKYKEYAETIVKLEQKIFEKNHMMQSVSKEEMGSDYEAAREDLNDLAENSKIEYLYAVQFADKNDPDSIEFVINGVQEDRLKEAEKESDVYSYLGEKCLEDDFGAEMKQAFLDAVNEKQDEVQFIVNNTKEYGYELTCYKAMTGEDGEDAIILATDISMDEINANLRAYVSRIIIIALIIFAIMTGLFIYIINRTIINPITWIADSSENFVKQTKEKESPFDLSYQTVEIKSKDEMYTLASSIEDMVNDLKSYMINLQKITEEKGRIAAELNVATSIQANMLPSIFPPFPDYTEFDIFATMHPAKEVGGDFYDFYLIDEDHLCITMADVSGKGVPAALFMVIAKTLLKDHVLMGKEPAEVFETVNNILCENNEDNMFVTAWMSIYEISTGKLTSVNAGHDYPLIRHHGKFEYYQKKGGFVLAGMENMKYKQFETTLEEGDIIYLYTDGIPEAIDLENNAYGCDRLEKCTNELTFETTEELILGVTEDVSHFVGEAEQFDDMTMLALKIHEKKG